MHLDVQDLRNFYYRSMLGRAAQKAIRDKVITMWPAAKAKGQTVAGFGFAVPLLRPYLSSARRVMGLMPAPQGVMPWPAGMQNVSVLVEDTTWPLDTGVVDKLVVMHGLETSETPSYLLDEAYRVLGPGGRALFITPNRAGLWVRSDATPFGYGRPYSLSQLEAQLEEHGFRVERHLSALYQPPSSKRFWLKTGNFWERAGLQLPLVLAGGVLMVEVSKQIPAPKRPGLAQAVKRPLKVLEGLGVPEPSASRAVGHKSI
ncbi:methyltransferase domain-containing protein [Aliiroseovarius sp. Z3]|uniref:class I SAM-dependent methyltransferase n=1 Tax=Aliiroseovarius sp. Z3 TaxID=2811402 RepID=UPI0023B212E2|nr:class I SAM-dependent methyltransferase [Aliiroseovarius sp. Z3]MDE9449722.1 methyltransferase domain-containing protein [Aliiroseovarius sp. Z3]